MVKTALDNLKIVKNMAKTRILVIGDIMLDRFVYGSVDRISPESPVPILSISRETTMLGGAGNTLSNLIHLKCDATIISLIGEDNEGMEIQNLIAELGSTGEGLITDAHSSTIVKTRFLAGHQQLLRADFEKNRPLTKDLEAKFIENAFDHMKDCKAVILSDYSKGLLTPHLIKSVIEQAQKHNIPVLVDPKGKNYNIYKGATAVTPNKKELSEATSGMPVETDEQVMAACRSLIQTSGINTIVATRSKDGMSIVDAHNAIHIRSASNIQVFDVSGAGDTVIATLAAALAAGADIKNAAGIANIAGSIVVTKVGTAPIRAEELLEVLEQRDPEANISGQNAKQSLWQAPILGWDKAKEQIQRWKARNLKVGFTNGCFDILHTGHISYLNDARSRCDRLVVGVNRDSSVKILKGPERPIHDEASRCAVLSALGCIDMVIPFGAEKPGDDNTANALIREIQPDIYFKGGDYTLDQIPEASAVREAGGIIEIMPSYEGHSSTASIKKMNSSNAA